MRAFVGILCCCLFFSCEKEKEINRLPVLQGGYASVTIRNSEYPMDTVVRRKSFNAQTFGVYKKGGEHFILVLEDKDLYGEVKHDLVLDFTYSSYQMYAEINQGHYISNDTGRYSGVYPFYLNTSGQVYALNFPEVGGRMSGKFKFTTPKAGGSFYEVSGEFSAYRLPDTEKK